MTQLAPEHRRLLEAAYSELRHAQERLETIEGRAHEPIAVVGMGLRLPPDIADPEAAWAAFRDGADGVGRLVTGDDGVRRDGTASPAGLLANIAGFDAGFFNISDAEAARMDPQQRLILQVAWEALEDAGIPPEHAASRTTGVYLGVYNTDYLTLQLKDPDSIDAYTAPGNAHSIIANRLSYLLDLTGPSVAVDTACSSSLTAMHFAVQALRSGECDLAIVGGVNVIAAEESTTLTGKVLPISSSGRCRSFDAEGDGIVRGEGAAVVVLERASDAADAERRTWSLIRGTAINQDGRTNGLTAPNPRAQRQVIGRALENAKAEPADVVYVEAHGTGTELGDPIEIESLAETYGPGSVPCALGSVKAQLGHLEAAAGVVGLLRAALALRHGEAPGQAHLDRLNPEISLEGTRLAIPRRTRALPSVERPRLAAVSSFGFGGANAHVVLQEPAPRTAAERTATRSFLLPFSARDPWSLERLTERYRTLLAGADADQAADVCAAAALGRAHHRHRRAVAADTPSALVQRLDEPAPAAPPWATAPDLVFVFSGQGGQWPGMTDGFDDDEFLKAELDTCDQLVREAAGWSLREALATKDPGRLAHTDAAQLAIAAVQLGIARRLSSYGLVPAAVIGHSMGELTAACVAGAMTRAELVEALLARAALAERAQGGAMSSIGLPEVDTRDVITATGAKDVDVAAVNGPASTVISGAADAVARVSETAAAQGVRVRPLPVGYAFHSPLLDGCDSELARLLAHLPEREPEIPFYSSVTGRRWSERLSPQYWGMNLREPVRFAAAAATMAPQRPTVFVELGPHPALLGELQRIADAEEWRNVRMLPSLRRDRDPVLSMDEMLAGLYENGCQIDWAAHGRAPQGEVVLPRYPWRERHYWSNPTPASSAPRATAPPPAVGGAAEPEGPTGPGRTAATLTDAIRRRVAAALGLDDIERIPADTPLREWGLESLQVVELRNQIERSFAVTIPLHVLLAGDSPAAVAAVLLGDDDPAQQSSVSRQEAAQTLDKLDELSEDDVEAMIAALAQEEQQ